MSADVKKLNPNSWGDVPVWAYSAVAAILESLKKVDPQTCYHCLRVGEYSRLLAKAAGLNEYQQKISEFAGILHDVGKMGIPVQITHKPGKLDFEEYALMKAHSTYSEEIIKPLGIHEFFEAVIPAVRSHHERIDGEGYPDKLFDEKIPLISRIILIVDTLDAMKETRAYRAGLPIERVYQELKKYSGTQFDKSLVNVFLAAHPTWEKEQPDKQTFENLVKRVA